MDEWKLEKSTPQRVYRRPLGLLEQGFYWDSQFSGTADTLQLVSLRVEPQRVTPELLERAWNFTKQRHPLLGARVEELSYRQQDFVLEESRLHSCIPGEIIYDSIPSAAEAHSYADRIINSPRRLTNDLLAQLFIILQADDVQTTHLIIVVAHMITDGMGNFALLRTLMEALSQPSVDVGPLEERLWLARSTNALFADSEQPVARQRWHRALGAVIMQLRMSGMKGGHTLPRKISAATPFTPTRSRFLDTSFSPSETKKIIQSCREQKVTFGNAYHVLGQIAMTRVLHRLHLAGKISDDEWAFRQREPFMPGGPLNQRPFLDPEWYARGGSATVNVAISFYFNRLPVMPGGKNAGAHGRLPTYVELLSKRRFFLRARMMKAQANAFVRHPRHIDINYARLPIRVAGASVQVERWRAIQRSGASDLSTEPISAIEQAKGANFVMTFGGSSMGNVSLCLPFCYKCVIPLKYPANSPEPIIEILETHTRLRTRPTELYLGGATFKGQLGLVVHYDGNVYEDALVQEWLDEVRNAVHWYLGDGAKAQDAGAGIQAKL
uniref:Condensation domain-containing protein n=1 Tax=Schizophyllum commune (strain H4-8 / FGSC 9210) TaxID=578458 RepID=D8PT78_SCHCM